MTLLSRRGVQLLGVLLFAPIFMLVFSTSENDDFLITEPAPKYLANLLTGVENDAVQFQKVGNGLWVYSAHIDKDCHLAVRGHDCVTSLALYKGSLEEEELSCYFMEKSKNKVTAVYGYNLVEANVSVHQVEIYANTLWKISCSGNFQPSLESVRLVRDQDVATVKVEKAPEKEEKQVLGICLAGVLWSSGGSEGANDLISFLEYYREAGAQGVFIYALPQVREVALVLDYYIALGFVKVMEWDFPSELLASPSLVYHGQNLLLHDCMYRSRGHYEFVVYTDLDERVIPSRPNMSLAQLVKMIDIEGISSFGLLVTFYLSTWKANLPRVRELYKGRERIPNIREAVFTEKEKG